MSAPIPHPLKHPVELKRADGSVIETISELQLHRLKGGDARKVLNLREKGAGDFIAALLCASARIPPSTFDQLDAEDIVAAAEVAGGFLGVAPAISKT
ncbi:phage tail assembly protein [Pseudaquabacterium pictum]|uniref:Phage tail assembly protein n=1 Tax=Pseudaquabacterium pictum TaxID=2315236 RepID=A0A480ASC2_9BURK|nr:phage tail assembly protein [Rubrivivax pictus]GCL64313.1 hypothetical protein AQPW35_33940 [Rubrivivax pictus]